MNLVPIAFPQVDERRCADIANSIGSGRKGRSRASPVVHFEPDQGNHEHQRQVVNRAYIAPNMCISMSMLTGVTMKS